MIGVLVALVTAVLSTYAQGFAWAISNGVLLDLSLTPQAFPPPAPSWVFVFVSAAINAALVLWLIPRPVVKFSRTRLRAAAITGAVLIVLAVIVHASSPPGGSINVLNEWQRAALFLSSSGAYIVQVIVLAYLTWWPEDATRRMRRGELTVQQDGPAQS